jgi:hypothetical protein
MKLSRFRMTSLFLSLALGAVLAAPASAAGLTSRVGKITGTGLLTNFTTATKVVNGKTVYIEDVPLLTANLLVGATTHYYHVRFSGDKATGWLSMLTQAEMAGASVTIHHNDDYKSTGRYECRNYLAEGCIEIIGPIKSPLIQWLTVLK